MRCPACPSPVGYMAGLYMHHRIHTGRFKISRCGLQLERLTAQVARRVQVGMMTEYATGLNFVDQIKLTITNMGFADIYE